VRWALLIFFGQCGWLAVWVLCSVLFSVVWSGGWFLLLPLGGLGEKNSFGLSGF
jgi:hypothetical protein